METGRIAKAWNIFAATLIPPNASQVQRDSMKMAFYGGASTLFYEIIHMLDPGDEPTVADLNKMTGIQGELNAFAERCKTLPKGTPV